MEHSPFFERLWCSIIMPARIMYAMYPLMKTINEQRRELGIEPVSDRHERTRNVLFLANTFFGFEVS